jgi:signal transduction histidine kinase
MRDQARKALHQSEHRLRSSESQLRALAARLQQAREEESKRIAREIHDELGQALTSLNIDLAWLEAKVARDGNTPLAEQLGSRFKSMTALLAKSARSVQRIARELRPGMLDDLGLTATLQWQAEEFQRRTGIQCRWKQPAGELSVGSGEATALFRIFQESLTNVARHAHAGIVELSLEELGSRLVLEISDDGTGFSLASLPNARSLGLLGMRERATLVGGRLTIRSVPGKGTKVRVILPLKNGRNLPIRSKATAILSA